MASSGSPATGSRPALKLGLGIFSSENGNDDQLPSALQRSPQLSPFQSRTIAQSIIHPMLGDDSGSDESSPQHTYTQPPTDQIRKPLSDPAPRPGYSPPSPPQLRSQSPEWSQQQQPNAPQPFHRAIQPAHSTSSSPSFISTASSSPPPSQTQVQSHSITGYAFDSPHTHVRPRSGSQSSPVTDPTLPPSALRSDIPPVSSADRVADEDVPAGKYLSSSSLPITHGALAALSQESTAKRVSRQGARGKPVQLDTVHRRQAGDSAAATATGARDNSSNGEFEEDKDEQSDEHDDDRFWNFPTTPLPATGLASMDDDGSSRSMPVQGEGTLTGGSPNTSPTRQILSNGGAFRPSADDVQAVFRDILSDHELDKPFIDRAVLPDTLAGGGSSSSPLTARQAAVVSSETLARERSTKFWGIKIKGKEVTPRPVSSSLTWRHTKRVKHTMKWIKGELIGQGMYNKVFLAMDASTGEMLVAKQAEMPQTIDGKTDAHQVKIISALEAECKTLGSLDHPNIIQYLGFEETNEFFTVFLEYVPGGSIKDHLRNYGKFAEDMTKSFTRMIVAGLAYLHDNKVIHQDLATENVLVNQRGICKISNFVTSTRSDDVYRNVIMTRAHDSIYWMAPEMVHNGKSVNTYSGKVDIWSLGCIFVEMLTGHGPWGHDDYVWIMLKAGQKGMVPPSSDAVTLSPEADDFRLQCLRQDPADRPTARALQSHPWLVISTQWQFNGFGSSEPGSHQLAESADTLQNLNVELDPPNTYHIPSATPVIGDLGDEITFDSAEPFDTRGNFCDLFIGTHKTAGKVALKRLRYRGGDEENITTMTRQFRRESDIWMTLRHNRILQCLGMFTRERSLYLVSPFMKNGSLFDWLRRGEPLGLERLRLIHELADALVYLHARGIVHGDVKANNVLLSDDMHVQLCDFGLTKLAESATTTSLKGAGTVRWQGPELWEDNPKSFKSDVYAFAMTIVEVLTSQIPFATITNDYTVIKAVSMRDQRPAQLPQISSDGRSYSNSWLVAERCWNADPDQRISMAEAVEHLASARSTTPNRRIESIS